VDFNITDKIFVGAEGRYNWVDRTNGSFGTYGLRTGVRFYSTSLHINSKTRGNCFKVLPLILIRIFQINIFPIYFPTT